MQCGIALPDCDEKPFGWLPLVIDAHDEADGWRRLQRTARGRPMLGLPTGAGVLVHRDGAQEPLRREPWRG